MISRYILILLGVISIVWIGYVGESLIDTNEEFKPNCFFGLADDQIVVINRIDEVELKDNNFSISQKSFDLFKSISKFLKKGNTIYLSKNQDQFLIYKKEKWKAEEVINLFKKSNIQIEKISKSAFKVGDFKLDFRNELVHIYTDNVQFPKVQNLVWLDFDHKASISIIEFKSKGTSVVIKDIYFNKNGSVEYISKGNGKLVGNQIDDQDLFSSALPNEIESYHFFEKNYYSNLDKVYKKGPMHYWLESGFVELKYKDELIILTDFVDNRDPFLLLNEISQDENSTDEQTSTFFKNIQLTKTFPKDLEEGFYIYKMDEFIVLSTSKSICNQFLMSNKRNQSTTDSTSIYLKELPKKVSERCISKKTNYSKTIYKNKIVETFFN